MERIFRCPTPLGRDRELRLLGDLLARAGSGRGVCVLVVGEAGVGKTRVVTETVALAAAAGAAVLAGRASAVAGGEPLRPVGEALAAVARARPVLDDPTLKVFLPVLARFAPSLSSSGSVEAPPVLIGEAVLRLAAALAPVSLIVLEDLHWADPATLAVLEYLADHCHEQGSVVLATMRNEACAAVQLANALAQRGVAELVRLARLDDASIDAMAAACLGTARMPAAVRQLVAAADGLPLLVEDLLADAASRGALRQLPDGDWEADAPADAAPPTFAASVVRRVAALPADAGRVLAAAAVLGRTFALPSLWMMTGLPEAAVGTAVRQAEAAQLVEPHPDGIGHRFRHALTREAVLATVSPGDRVRLARAALGSAGLSATGAAELQLMAGDRDAAAASLIEAAAAERASGTVDTAITLLARARRVALGADVSRRAGVEFVATLAAAGRADEAFAAGAELLPYLTGADASRLHRGLAAAALQAQDHVAASEQLTAAVTGTSLSDADWAEIWSLNAGLALASGSAGRVTEAEHLAHRAVAAAERTGQAAATCDALLVLGRCARLRELAAAEEAFGRALTVADAGNLVLARIAALAELGTLQMLRDVRADVLEQAHAAAERVGALVTATGIEVNLAGVRIMRGELGEAVEVARRCQRQARRFRMKGALPAAMMLEGAALGMAGQPALMEDRLRGAEQEGGDDTDVLAGCWAIGRATVALLAEDRERANWALAKADRLISSQPVLMIDPAAGPSVLLAAVGGTADHAAIDAAEVRSGRGSAWTRMWVESARAVLAGATDADPAEHWRQASSAAARYPVFGLLAVRLAAEAAVRDGWGEPGSWLAEIEVAATTRGYPRLAAASRSLLRRTGVPVARRRATDAGLNATLRTLGITTREAEVLALMPDRPTNPQIAAALFLSSRTVEKHIASLLRKTGATDRSQLAHVARDPDTAPALRR